MTSPAWTACPDTPPIRDRTKRRGLPLPASDGVSLAIGRIEASHVALEVLRQWRSPTVEPNDLVTACGDQLGVRVRDGTAQDPVVGVEDPVHGVVADSEDLRQFLVILEPRDLVGCPDSDVLAVPVADAKGVELPLEIGG